jgi:hypothetical protein
VRLKQSIYYLSFGDYVFQKNLTLVAARSFAADNFESKWINSDASDGEKHLLEGMVRTCDTMPGMEDHCFNCDEITLPYLQNDRGRGYLNLLKHYMLEDLSSPSEPIFLPNPRWDSMMGKNKKNLSDRHCRPMLMVLGASLFVSLITSMLLFL